MTKKENLFFKADKISGFEGNLLFSSIILEVIKQANRRNRYKFPFYGLSLNLEKEKGDEWIREKEYEKECDRIVADYEKSGKKYFGLVKNTVTREAAAFHECALKLMRDLPKLSKQELVEEYKKFCAMYASYYGLGAITFLFEHILSERLAFSLLARYNNATEIISDLLKTDYKSFMAKSDQLLYQIKREKNEKKRKVLIEKYQRNFFFMKTNYRVAPILAERTILEMAKKVKRNKKVEVGRVNSLKSIKLTQEEKIIVSLLKQAEVIRDQRKQLNITGSYILGRFLDEAVRQNRVLRNIMSEIFWYEYNGLIKNPKKITPKLSKRKEASIVLEKNRAYYFEKIAIKESIQLKKVKEIKGTPASKGIISGNARIVLSSKNFRSFRNGEILVAEMTRPDFLPILKKASAIVTDEGGLTCHAAIIARELGIPCVVGTKVATRLIKNGQKITVDGNRGTIKS